LGELINVEEKLFENITNHQYQQINFSQQIKNFLMKSLHFLKY